IFSKEGYIITNDHVIDGATNITVILNNLKEYKATVVGRDPISDLSIIKINYGKDIPVVSFGDSSKIDIGNIVIAIGNPFGLSNSLTFGVVSAKGRTDIDKNASFKHFIQTDASINQGNSGGPLIDLNGNVIGVNTQILSTAGKGSIGIGFAIPINITKQIIKQLIIKGKVERGYIGAIVGPIPKEIAKYFKIEDKAGIFVNDILPNGPAYKAGLKPGDIILSINNQSVKTTAELIGLISEIHPNHPAKINILRNGKKQLLTIFVANRPNEVVLNNNLNEETKKNDWLGITLGLSNSKKNNNIQSPIVVKDININSPAFNKLRVGDIVESINYKPINSLSTLNKVIREEKNKKSFLFVVIRKGRRLFFVIDDN
ncbi:MAG: trypsin-like peptidase domain-containing protein, partial [Spirochaetota bacterium]|nr:trypsin-like peptidase domain-containing protein [Spirochaetota bacterium]